MRLFHHYHRRRLYALVHSDFVNFELSVWLHTIARSLISVFIPILMLRFGFSLTAVLAYYLIFNAIDVPLNLVARRYIIAFGARSAIILATLAAIVYFLLFHDLASLSWTILLVLAAIDAVYDTFYWVAHMYLFMESSSSPEQAGHDTGVLSSVRLLGGMFGPAIGAGILLLGNQNILIGATIVFFALSIIPLLRLRHVRNRPETHGPTIRDFFRELREKRDYLSFALASIDSCAESTLWPLFIFLLFGTLASIAIVAVIVSISTIVFTYLTGNITKKNGEMLVVIGSACAAVLWALRLAFPDYFFYYSSIFLMGFFGTMIGIPLDSNILERARIKDTLMASTFRNLSAMLAMAVLFAVLLPLVSVFKVSFLIAIGSLFALIAIHRLFILRMRKAILPLEQVEVMMQK